MEKSKFKQGGIISGGISESVIYVNKSDFVKTYDGLTPEVITEIDKKAKAATKQIEAMKEKAEKGKTVVRNHLLENRFEQMIEHLNLKK